MATGSYSYNPADLKENTMSRMRFELGDGAGSRKYLCGNR